MKRKSVTLNFDIYVIKQFRDKEMINKNMDIECQEICENIEEYKSKIFKLNDTDYYVLKSVKRFEHSSVYGFAFLKLVEYNMPQKMSKNEGELNTISLNEGEYIVPKVTHFLIDSSEGIALIQSGNDIISSSKIENWFSDFFKKDYIFEPHLNKSSIDKLQNSEIAWIDYAGISGQGNEFLNSDIAYDQTIKVKFRISSVKRNQGMSNSTSFYDKVRRLVNSNGFGKLVVRARIENESVFQEFFISETIERFSFKFSCNRGEAIISNEVFNKVNLEYLKKRKQLIKNCIRYEE